MGKSVLELMMHPVRMRIITVVAGREQTASQIAQSMPDVAQATLYRHIKVLEKGGILEIVAENPIRGTVEKVYALVQGGELHQDNVDDLTKDDHLRYFTTFMTTLLAQFEQYVTQSETVDPAKDGVGYHTTILNVTDEELQNLVTDLNRTVQPYLQNEASEKRKRLYFSTILMPAENHAGHDNAKENNND